MKRRTNAVHRAWLYITRKRSKSVLLFLILLVLTTLVTAGVAVGNAAGRASLELRRTMGSYFKIEENQQYTGARTAITDVLVERIAGLSEIKNFNKIILQYLMVPDLVLEPGRFTGEMDERAKLTRFLGVTESRLHEYFLLRSLQLKEGKQIGPEDEGAALISETLAKQNGLKVGDIITGAFSQEGSRAMQKESGNETTEVKTLPENGDEGKRYEWKIAGIFEVNTEVKRDAMTAECDLLNNFIFVDEKSLMRVQADISSENAGKYRQASFFVDDPAQIEHVMAQVRGIDGVNWDSLQINVNEQAYTRASEPLKRLELYSRLFLIIIIVISVVLLTLILTLWMRDRRQEIGVLMASGIRKRSLIGQHLTELLLLVMLSLAVALPFSGLVVKQAGHVLSGETVQEEAREKQAWELFYDPVETSGVESGKMIQAYVGIREFLFAVFYGIGTGCFAVGFSSAWILQAKPREILSSMS